jgi:formamidopyrimidine-DNA glycosylase
VPELPEVELVRRGLAATVVGSRVRAVEVRSQSSLAMPSGVLERAVVGRALTAVTRRGKALIVHLDSGMHLLIHPMMTGQFVVTDGARTLFAGGHPSRSMLGAMPNQTTRVIFRLDGGRALHFNDARKFGRIRLLDDPALAAEPFLRRLGPDALEDRFTVSSLRSQLARRAPVKALILDQSVIAGVGNIYADESLHLGGIHPARPAGGLSTAEARRLHRAIRRILALAIESGGSSVAERADRGRAPAGYLARARVFRRQGRPCPTCGTAIDRIRVAGRATNICPRCQPTRACEPPGRAEAV